MPCFYRAPTDNDQGGPGGQSYDSRWIEAGLDQMEISSVDSEYINSNNIYKVIY